MNKSHSKLIARLQPKAPPLVQTEPKHSLKRKHEGEEFKRTVRTKLESSSTRPGDDLKIKIQLKKDPMHSSQRVSRKENIPRNLNKSKSMSKSINARSDSVLSAIQKSLNKLGGKPARPAPVEKVQTSSHTVLEQKVQSKAALKSKFDELMKSVQEFGQKRCLFTNLQDLTNQMDNEYNPAFELCNEKIQQIEKEFADRKVKQFQEIENLKAKITTLKETQEALALSLSEKKRKNEKIESDEEELENKVRNYDEFIQRNRELLAQLLSRKEDLCSFQIKVEEAIRNIKEKVSSRYDDISTEEKKLLILEELLHSKKHSIRSFLFLRGEKTSLENCNSEFLYKIHAHENSRRVKLEFNKSLQDHNPRFYEFDSIYYINNYQNREKKIFAQQDKKFYSNVLTTIFDTEQNAGYVFFLLTHDKFSADLFKELVTLILQKHLDKTWPETSAITEIEFDNKGKIISESSCHLEEYGLNVGKEEFDKGNYLLTFQVKLKNMTTAKRFTFIIVPGVQKDLISTLKKAIVPTKIKKRGATSMSDISYDNQDLMALLQSTTEGSSIYTILTMKTEQNKPTSQELVGPDSLECLELLNTLNRFKG